MSDPVADGSPSLARRQEELVAALVSGGELPPGFDVRKVDAAREALLRKRSGEVAVAWPALAAGYGPQWTHAFGAYAAARPPGGALRDGWDFARHLAAQGDLSPAATAELRARERAWRYHGRRAPRRRLTSRLLHRA